MGELTGADGSYAQRCEILIEHGIALWDVLESSVRPGSMDADIRRGTEKVNDFDSFFLSHADVLHVCFNGQKAAQMFRKFVRLESTTAAWKINVLPSTSPAHASMPYSEKLERWRQAITSA